MVRLGQREATEPFAARHWGQPVFLLFIRPEEIDRHHRQRPLDGSESPQPAIAALQFLHHQSGRDISKSRTSVAFDRRPENPELRQLRHELERKSPAAIMLRDHGEKPASTQARTPSRSWRSSTGQQIIELVEIGPAVSRLRLGHHRLD